MPTHRKSERLCGFRPDVRYRLRVARSYTQLTIKLLFGTATHCAFPNCRNGLILRDRGLLTPVAQIAHIRSESSKGPRYDPTYPASKINDFDNLLLLCGIHHPPVDAHDSAYPTTELLEWKVRQTIQGVTPMEEADLAAIDRILNKIQPILADAILRGPIAHLNEAERFQQAEDRLASAPVDAAHLFDQIAARLDASPFAQHASMVRARQATALEAGQQYAEAARVRINLGWRSYHAGDPGNTQRHIKEVARYQNHIDQSEIRAANGLAAAAAFGYDRNATIEELAVAFDEMDATDLGWTETALSLAEQSITWRRPDLVASRASVLERVAAGTALDSAGLTVRARLLMCLADASGNWSELAESARQTYPALTTAWITARYARHLGLSGKPDQALQRWAEAAERATNERANESAALWLYSQRATRVRYMIFDGDPNELHRLAQALRSVAGGSVLPEPYPLAERSADSMLDQRWPDALQALHQQLTHAVITASWGDELAANARLGDLFVETGKWDRAVTHYIRAGQPKKLEQLAKSRPDQELLFEPIPDEAPVWERIAAFRFAAAGADVLPDVQATAWSEKAIDELKKTGYRASAAVDTWLPAFKVFACTADRASAAHAQEFLDLTVSYFRRPQGQHLHTDDDHIKALVMINQGHPQLRDQVLSSLCDAVLLGDEVGRQAAFEGQEVLRSDPDTVAQRLSGAASGGNLQAALGLILAGADTSPAVDLAREHFARDSQPVTHQPGVAHLGTGIQQTALLMPVLDQADRDTFGRAMLTRAQDTKDIARNRQDALSALHLVADQLSEEVRAELFDGLQAFVRNPTDSELSFDFGDDPFSRFKVSLGVPPLAAAALRAAGALAHAPSQYEAVQEMVVYLLPGADDSACFVLGTTLRDLPPEALKIDVNLLAAHPNRWIRACAAMAWGRQPDRWPGLGERLAVDPAPGVRYALASVLDRSRGQDQVRQILEQDHQRDIRRRLSHRGGGEA